MKGEGTREKGKNAFFESSQEQEDYDIITCSIQIFIIMQHRGVKMYVGTEALAYQ